MEVEDEIIPDFENISQALKLLSMDYLGGHGSRGYGKVTFSDFKIEVKSGNCPVDIEKLMQLLGGVEEYGIFTVQA
jgi:CRISPR-associated protein Csm3